MEAALQGPSGRTVLGAGVLTIGRTPDNQLVVNDPKASSHHAEVRQAGQDYTIADLGSTNGTFVNEQRLAPGVPRQLSNSDRVRIGDATFTYQVTGATEVAPSGYAGQGSSPGYLPTALAGPSEYTAYGAGEQQPQQGYPPPQQYGSSPHYGTPPPQQYGSSPQQGYPPQQGYAPPQQYGSSPQQGYPPQQGYAPPQQYGSSPQYGAQPQQGYPPPQQGYTPPPSYTPAGGVGTVPSYGMPPTVPPSQQPAQKKPAGGMRMLLIVVAVIVVLAIIAIPVYLLTRPHLMPTLSVTSSFKVGSTAAGSTGTVLHVRGQQFSSNSAITFLLDGSRVPGSPAAQSDANGNVQTDLTITNGWSVGNHTLTAKDANNVTTQTGVPVAIVPQGQANTPGPNGAPADDASFSVNASIQRQDATNGQQLNAFTLTLSVTGQPDPAGGKVCQSRDNGQSQTLNGNVGSGITYNETIAWSCSGSYKGGKLTYDELAMSDKYTFSTGITCTASTPYKYEHLDGSFTDHSTIGGNYSADTVNLTCSNGKSPSFDAEKGTWSGTSS